jgi:hypothetical protein
MKSLACALVLGLGLSVCVSAIAEEKGEREGREVKRSGTLEKSEKEGVAAVLKINKRSINLAATGDVEKTLKALAEKGAAVEVSGKLSGTNMTVASVEEKKSDVKKTEKKAESTKTDDKGSKPKSEEGGMTR